MYHAADQALFYPETPADSRTFVATPDAAGLPFESVAPTAADRVRLHAFLILQPNPRHCPTILFLHGNAGNVGHRLANAKVQSSLDELRPSSFNEPTTVSRVCSTTSRPTCCCSSTAATACRKAGLPSRVSTRTPRPGSTTSSTGATSTPAASGSSDAP